MEHQFPDQFLSNILLVKKKHGGIHPYINLKTLPSNLQIRCNISIVPYQLHDTVKDHILSYKKTVNLIFADVEVLFRWNTNIWEFERSQFPDLYHKPIITGGLHITDNSKLKKFMRKFLPCTFDFTKALIRSRFLILFTLGNFFYQIRYSSQIHNEIASGNCVFILFWFSLCRQSFNFARGRKRIPSGIITHFFESTKTKKHLCQVWWIMD